MAGLKVKLQTERAAVIVITLTLEMLVEAELGPMVPEKTDVVPAGYGLSTLVTMRDKVCTMVLLKIPLRVITLPTLVQALF